jgi:hypothetical protein
VIRPSEYCGRVKGKREEEEGRRKKEGLCERVGVMEEGLRENH